MVSWWSKFLLSKASGWIAVAAILTISVPGTMLLYQYKELQRKAAYCEGRLEAKREADAVRDRAIDYIREEGQTTIDELKGIKDAAEEQRKERPELPVEEGEITPPSGCAAERAPESILRYHGWVRD